MRIEPDIKLNFDDVLIRPKRSKLTSRSEVEIKRSLFNRDLVPLVVSNMDTTGTFNMSIALRNMYVAIHKFYSADEVVEFFKDNPERIDKTIISSGITDEDKIRLKKIQDDIYELVSLRNLPIFMLDVANGYMEKFVDTVKWFRDNCYGYLIAGTVATAEMTEALLIAGADCVRVGIGSGSICRTRHVTGVGYPLLASIIECADAAHGLNGLLLSDGGCASSGDVCKAFGAGADLVMSGRLFAGTDECSGKFDGNTFEYYGMASKKAQDKHNGGISDYRSPEGTVHAIERKGPASVVADQIFGGIRSCCTYVGAERIKDLPKRTTFVRTNNIHRHK